MKLTKCTLWSMCTPLTSKFLISNYKLELFVLQRSDLQPFKLVYFNFSVKGFRRAQFEKVFLD